MPSVVVGGMGGITQAMARAAAEQGVEIRTETEVEQIRVEDGRATGVRLANGEELSARLVVSNADPKRTFLKLLAEDAIDASFRDQISGLSTKAACLKFHAVLDEPLDLSPYLGEGHDPRYSTYVTLAPDGFETYRRAWRQAQEGTIPDQPVCHIQVPTAYDSSLTDRDGEIVSIWTLYAPSRPAQGGWDDRREETAESLIDYVATFVPNFRSAMNQWELFTPLDIERRVGLTDGCIRHIDMIPGQLYGDRPLPGAGYSTPIARPLALRGRHAPGRRGDRRPRPQRSARDPRAPRSPLAHRVPGASTQAADQPPAIRPTPTNAAARARTCTRRKDSFVSQTASSTVTSG